MLADTLARQMLFCTVRITNTSPLGTSTGTGFHFNASLDGTVSIPLIITNRHVVENATSLRFEVLHGNADLTVPKLGTRTDVTVDVDLASLPWVAHPDPQIDVVAIPARGILNTVLPASGSQPFYRSLGPNLYPSAAAEADLDAIEELTFVGYPNGWADDVHHTPIFRRAITATPLALPFGGKPTFLLDGSVFGGSSGSPVFVYNRNGYTAEGSYHVGASRLLLVGIVSATMVRQDLLPLEVSTAPHTRVAREMNLGVAYSWKSIEETVEATCLFHNIERRNVAPSTVEVS